MRLVAGFSATVLSGLGVWMMLCCASTAQAQVAGQKLGACPERIFLTADQLAAAMAMATLGTDSTRITLAPGGDEVVFGQIRECASKIHYAVCTDKMLLGLLDPGSAAGGAAAGLFIDRRNGPSLLGAMVGSGTLGMIGGTVNIAMCNKRLEEDIRPPALIVFDRWQVKPDTVRAAQVRDRITSAAATRRITAVQGQALLNFIDQGLGILTR